MSLLPRRARAFFSSISNVPSTLSAFKPGLSGRRPLFGSRFIFDLSAPVPGSEAMGFPPGRPAPATVDQRNLVLGLVFFCRITGGAFQPFATSMLPRMGPCPFAGLWPGLTPRCELASGALVFGPFHSRQSEFAGRSERSLHRVWR